MDFIKNISEKITVLHDGMILCEGTMEEVQNDERVIEKYLGRDE
jgi:urea transport system ATP-binding protein